jgi:hypothetical protein
VSEENVQPYSGMTTTQDSEQSVDPSPAAGRRLCGTRADRARLRNATEAPNQAPPLGRPVGGYSCPPIVDLAMSSTA